MSPEIADRIVEVELQNLRARIGPYAERPGNPAGVHMARFGRAYAFVATQIPVRFFNSVLGTEEATLEHFDAIEAFYAEHGVAPSFEVAPGRLTPRLAVELGARGYVMTEFHTGLARQVSASDAAYEAPAGIEIDRIDPWDDAAFDRFLDVYLEGWGTAADGVEDSKENMRGWRGNAGWSFYLGSVSTQLAGAAILDVQGPTAMIASASTLPALRGRGVQMELVKRRIADAAAAGCDLVVGGAYYGTPSMRNQQRAGLYTAFTRGIWFRPEPPCD